MILLLTGTSSSGKSSVTRALQRQLGEGWLYFSTDDYLNMLGNAFEQLHPDNPDVCTPNAVCYARKHADGSYEIIPGPLCSKLYATIPDVLATLAAQGFHLVVDSFITTCKELQHYQEMLGDYGLFSVYLYADNAIIAQRETARGDRLPGSALHWLRQFDFQERCGMRIDTGTLPVETVCQMVMDTLA